MIVASSGVGFYYAHCSSRLDDGVHVKPGDWVSRIGSSSSYIIVPHLHFMIFADWRNPRYTAVDPHPDLMAAKAR